MSSKCKFKVGDWVKCVNPSEWPSFKDNKAYRVIMVTSNGAFSLDNPDYNTPIRLEEDFELAEPRVLSLFELEEGKVYEVADRVARYRVSDGKLMFKTTSSGWHEDYTSVATLCSYGFQEVTTPPPLRVASLDYPIEKQLDGSLKIGCQTVTPEDWKKIKEYVEEGV